MPVTVIEVGPCVVTQIKTVEKDGYSAVQIGFDDIKPRRSTMPMIGHDGKAGTGPKRHHVEFRVDEKEAGEFELGQSLTVESFAKHAFVEPQTGMKRRLTVTVPPGVRDGQRIRLGGQASGGRGDLIVHVRVLLDPERDGELLRYLKQPQG